MNIKELIEKYEYLNHNYFRRVDTSEVLKDLRQLDKPQKVTVPQFVADVIEEAKEESLELEDAFEYARDVAFRGEIGEWFMKLQNRNNFARAWLDGYEAEKEKRYTVVIKKTKQPLFYNNLDERLFFSLGELATRFTRKQIEDAGLGEVFNSPLFEVEEVE